MKKQVRKEVESNRLTELREKLSVVEKSKEYIEKELPKLRDSIFGLKDKIRKEKKAISLINRAKRIRK